MEVALVVVSALLSCGLGDGGSGNCFAGRARGVIVGLRFTSAI